jgi:hypothetical protein
VKSLALRYVLVIVTLVIAANVAYLLGWALPGQLVEAALLAFVLGFAYSALVYPWIAHKLGARDDA